MRKNAGTVEEIGGVSGFKSDPVVVYGGWSEIRQVLFDRVTNPGDWAGIGQPGGYAEYMKTYFIPLLYFIIIFSFLSILPISLN
jgi:NADPH:quinone reductase-like Zn-dependent oxidoreductase